MSARIGHRLKSFTGTRHSELAVVWWAFRRSGKIQCTNEHGPVAQRERASLAWKRSGVRFPSGPPRLSLTGNETSRSGAPPAVASSPLVRHDIPVTYRPLDRFLELRRALGFGKARSAAEIARRQQAGHHCLLGWIEQD